MFHNLRLRLTLLYLAAGAGLSLAMALTAYGLVSYYFQRTTDRALQHVMAEHMELLGAELPTELWQAEETWYSGAASLLPPQISAALRPVLEQDPSFDPGQVEFHETAGEQALDAELAAIFVLALNERGRLLPGFNLEASPLAPDTEAVEEALEHGHDFRTVRAGGTRIRLLTYQLQGIDQPRILQVGRSLRDQQQLLALLGVGLFVFGAVTLAGLAAASWWLAGESLRPTELAFERQQSFVANASHELRAPLTLIRSSAEVARSKASGKQASLLDDILHEVDHMSRLIEDQLLLSRLDVDRLPLTLQPIALHTLAGELVRQVQDLPAATGLAIGCSAEPIWTQGDPTRLRQVLHIILDNAIQHTPDGGTINVQVLANGSDVVVRVEDDGPGIPPADLGHVLDRFYRVDKARRRGQGSGLGLSIATALVRAHRGELTIESQPGQGTTVSVRLPRLHRS
jgi:signal transduction histidine kinase